LSTNAFPAQPDDRRLAATRRVIAFVNHTHGTDFTLARRLPGGHQSGAYVLEPAVLKWSTDKSWARQMSRAAWSHPERISLPGPGMRHR
jgi:hypothetical protein